jgi:hypothetical protein
VYVNTKAGQRFQQVEKLVEMAFLRRLSALELSRIHMIPTNEGIMSCNLGAAVVGTSFVGALCVVGRGERVSKIA